MECFRQIARFVKAPFKRTPKRVLEIGPPTNFRKESPTFFSDDESTLTAYSLSSTLDKAAVGRSGESKRDKIKHHVRRMSVKLPRPLPDNV
ncbi:hypothetical protein ASPWEDRAFT_170942 [Aspergillus wentii DTO 134E9]|uniref:Uncharacterized protein n=1 Tax=Aspergillus wentii DTO 134E9 TaxID=1073089 RepID=A0A1L9RRL7_ASPWE|nr:uncharacterized protein ASPWEDRAFT_170942 [Aspergillus wentii DTO 134E9]KAI9930317.1 hypothetical protein MW887_011069 [Aspergillus wentii]OJJ37467.1 hypothetical protein ASPWEDRAFT_170942 [Aspergillus wentii DTO 134E9]